MKVFITILLCLSVAFAQQPDSRCPPNEDSKTPTHFGHPTDCTKFFKCHNGQAHVNIHFILSLIKSLNFIKNSGNQLSTRPTLEF